METLGIHMADQHDVVLGISESWLNEESPQHLLQLEGYSLERLDRSWGDKKPSGGVAIYIRNDMSYSTTNYQNLNLSTNDIEIQWVEVFRTGNEYCCCKCI